MRGMPLMVLMKCWISKVVLVQYLSATLSNQVTWQEERKLPVQELGEAHSCEAAVFCVSTP